MKKTLIVGYGNPDRQDDGVAWHVLIGLAAKLNQPVPPTYDEGFPPSDLNPQMTFSLQLTPEMAEIIAGYERVCFVDAHTGNVPGQVHVEPIRGEFQTSPFTHHLTATSCLYLAETLYACKLDALMVSVRGTLFGFEHQLSPETARYAQAAVTKIYDWLQE
jgi:hydrogenase maturation protease